MAKTLTERLIAADAAGYDVYKAAKFGPREIWKIKKDNRVQPIGYASELLALDAIEIQINKSKPRQT